MMSAYHHSTPPISVILAGLAALCCLAAPTRGGDSPATQSASPQPVAVIELFTSEGCSTCPPAEALFARLQEDAVRKHQPLFFLAFHVDYWNRLGWVDPFSSPEFSRRQSQYAAAAQTEPVYTPQMIVNGGPGFSGADEDEAGRQIESALVVPASQSITITLKPSSPKRISVTCNVTNPSDGDQIHIALVQHAASTPVRAGENAGHTLHHVNVVRAFFTRPLTLHASAQIDLALPDGLDPANASVIAFTQSPHFNEVRGATSIELR